MAFWNWSRTAANNATAMAGGWPEGMAPSQVNDSARVNGSELACYRDDIAGAIVTGGTATAYTVSSYSVFDTLANMNGQMIAFVLHAANSSGACTLNVDGLGAKPLRRAPGVDPTIGMMIAGTPYTVTYNNSDAVFYLHGIIANPQNSVPIGACLPYFGASAPNSYFAIPLGQAISRTTYAALFTLFGTTYGAGDGSTTFNLPDLGGRVLAGKEATAIRLTSTYFGGNSTTLGAVGGSESHTLTIAQLASHNHSGGTGNDTPDHTHGFVGTAGNVAISNAGGVSLAAAQQANQLTTGASARHTHSISAEGGGGAHNNVQPTIVCNFILRVL